MSIWFNENIDIEKIKGLEKNTIHELIGLEVTELKNNSISGKIPIDHRTKQPAGILHGGASVVLAEGLGSIASNLIIDQSQFYAVGQSVNASHIRPGIKGYAHGTASPIHIGRKSHLWEIKITNDEGKLLCVSRLTMAILPKE
jgi:1,4-dihydroxy-2-naphthoyl-CoA hydrolase